MTTSATSADSQRLVQRADVARPDVMRELPEVCERSGFIQQELDEPAVSLAKIAGGTGGHYVAARVVTAAHLRLHVIHGQRGRRELLSAVHAAPFVPLENFLAFHDGRVS